MIWNSVLRTFTYGFRLTYAIHMPSHSLFYSIYSFFSPFACSLRFRVQIFLKFPLFSVCLVYAANALFRMPMTLGLSSCMFSVSLFVIFVCSFPLRRSLLRSFVRLPDSFSCVRSLYFSFTLYFSDIMFSQTYWHNNAHSVYTHPKSNFY